MKKTENLFDFGEKFGYLFQEIDGNLDGQGLERRSSSSSL
jgi:hypothetical protein